MQSVIGKWEVNAPGRSEGVDISECVPAFVCCGDDQAFDVRKECWVWKVGEVEFVYQIFYMRVAASDARSFVTYSM
jgi:hypothetical protein